MRWAWWTGRKRGRFRDSLMKRVTLKVCPASICRVPNRVRGWGKWKVKCERASNRKGKIQKIINIDRILKFKKIISQRRKTHPPSFFFSAHRGQWECCVTRLSPRYLSQCSSLGLPVSLSRPPRPSHLATAAPVLHRWCQDLSGSTTQLAWLQGEHLGGKTPAGSLFLGCCAQRSPHSFSGRT